MIKRVRFKTDVDLKDEGYDDKVYDYTPKRGWNAGMFGEANWHSGGRGNGIEIWYTDEEPERMVFIPNGNIEFVEETF